MKIVLSERSRKALFIGCLLFSLHPLVASSAGLIGGVAFALLLTNPYSKEVKSWTTKLLQVSVIGLGAGMNLITVAKVGAGGIGYTFIGILLCMAIGLFLGKLFRTEKETSLLVSVGTAICGGSAIAAVAPTIRAKSESTSVSLAIVFLLNSVGLLLFPAIGHFLELNQTQFGLWSALAIHDTSSVVGAASQFGAEALQIATTVKLARALWIVPLTIVIGMVYGEKGNAKKPWFILGFVLMAALVTYVPELKEVGGMVQLVSRRLLVATLFLIGSQLSQSALKTVGFKPLLQAIVLWIMVSILSLAGIFFGFVT